MNDMNDEPQQEPPQADDPATDEAAATPSTRRRWQLAAAAAVAVLLAGIGIATVMADENDGEGEMQTRTESDPSDGDGAAPSDGDGAVVAVTFEQTAVIVMGADEPPVGTEPVDVQLRFVDADGEEVATRHWSEVEEAAQANAGAGVAVGGLLQDVPAGDLRLEASIEHGEAPESTDQLAACTQPFTAAAGDRLILRLEEGPMGSPGGDAECARVVPVEEWAQGRTSPTGEDYVGLAQDEAEAQAAAAGLTTRVAGIDGMDLAMTMDLRPDRLDLVVFDGTVVAAQLGGEATGSAPPG